VFHRYQSEALETVGAIACLKARPQDRHGPRE